MPETIESWWRKAVSGLLDCVYPGVCEFCGILVKGGHCVCETCSAEIPRLKEPFCEQCGETFEGAVGGSFSCPNCRDVSFAFDFARPALKNSEEAMKLIGHLKYRRRLHFARDLAVLTCSAFDDTRLSQALEDKWPLVPVPLHRKRFRWRQFNQAREIALPLGRLLGLPISDLLKRTRPTSTQTRLTRSQRQKNLKGAFQAKPNEHSGVILIDDVFTTGSTVHECAYALKKAGTQKVVVVTVVRG